MSSNFFPSLLILLMFISNAKSFQPKTKISYSTQNWMSNIPDTKLILLMNIPGAHDTSANIMNPLAEEVARTQNRTIPYLLKAGIRKLDIRVALFDSIEEEDEDLHTCHGMFDCYYIDEYNTTRNLTYKHILLDIKKFLEENPSETVILWTQSEKGDSFENIKRAVDIMEKYVEDLLVNFDKSLTLGEVRGKIVTTVYRTYDEQGEAIYHKGIEAGTDLEEIHMKYIDKYYYNSWQVTGELKVEEVLDFFRTYNITIKQAEDILFKEIEKFPYYYSIACTGEHVSILPMPKHQAEIVNPFILKYDFIKGNYYGWIEMDYADIIIAKKFIDTNFYE